jgi:hypothetical protein
MFSAAPFILGGSIQSISQVQQMMGANGPEKLMAFFEIENAIFLI